MNKLSALQTALKVGKGRVVNNKSGRKMYNYRNAADILAAVKPLLEKHGLFITMSDALIEVGLNLAICATVQLHDDDTILASVDGVALHPLSDANMGPAQISGSSSSYARKYALGGLFALDDEVDADMQAEHDHAPQGGEPARPAAPAKEPLLGQPTVTRDQGAQIKQAREAAGLSTEAVFAMMKEPPFCCEKPPSDLLSMHVPTLISRIEAKMEGK